MTEPICVWCKQPAKGLAAIGDDRYCHDGDSPTCYELAQQAASNVGDGFLGQLLADQHRQWQGRHGDQTFATAEAFARLRDDQRRDASREFANWVATQRAYNGSEHEHGQSLYNECINAVLPTWAEEWAAEQASPETGGEVGTGAGDGAPRCGGCGQIEGEAEHPSDRTGVGEHLFLADLRRHPEGQVRLYVGGDLVSGTFAGQVIGDIDHRIAAVEQQRQRLSERAANDLLAATQALGESAPVVQRITDEARANELEQAADQLGHIHQADSAGATACIRWLTERARRVRDDGNGSA